MSTDMVLLAVTTAITTAGLVYFYNTKSSKKGQSQKEEKKNSPEIENSLKDINVKEDAEREAKQIILNAKDEALKIKQAGESESSKAREKAIELEKRAAQRLDEVYEKMRENEASFKKANELRIEWENKLKEVEAKRQEQ
ncbi:hypothetical protein CO178_00570, partial [candidate division WWE3 bacterium CG_4_9_14_3_um_filter_34_6]